MGDGAAQHDVRRGAAFVVSTAAAWFALHGTVAIARGLNPLRNLPWFRWDAGHYYRISQLGYRLVHCRHVPNRSPKDWCGSTGWFPGYPYASRVVGWTGIGPGVALRLVTTAAFLGTLALLWSAFLRTADRRTTVLLGAAVVVFPASVYYGAIFPVSMVTCSLIAGFACMRQGRWLWAGIATTVAVVSYPSGVLVVAMALVPSLSSRCTTLRSRLAATTATALPPLAAYGLVLLNFQRAVGRWNAWFLVQASYHYEGTTPWGTIGHRAERIWSGTWRAWTGLQTVWVLVVVVALAVAVVRAWGSLDDGRRAAAVVGATMWLAPLVLGGPLSLHRAESLLLPIVVLFPLLPRRWAFALVVAAAPIAVGVSDAFFRNLLV